MAALIKGKQLEVSTIVARELGILTTKGDIMAFDTDEVRVPVGTNDFVLTADSTASAGVAWKAVASLMVPRQEAVTTQAITGTDTAVTDVLDFTPESNASVSLF